MNDFDTWIWWGGLSLAGLVIGWFTLGMAGVEIVIGASLAAALVLFMLVSPIRLRIIPAVLAVLAFLALGMAPVWLFFKPIPGISIAVEYFVFLPIYILLLFYLLMRVLKYIIEHILPEGPGLIMDMLSQATEKIAVEAYHQYADIVRENHQPVYYGRILYDE